MKASHVLIVVLCSAPSVYACSGSSTTINDVADGSIPDSSGGNDSGGKGDAASDGGGGTDTGSGKDSGSGGDDSGGGMDSGGGDGCPGYVSNDCDGGCPGATVCVRKAQSIGTVDLGCYPVGQCGMTTPCQCIGDCVCTFGGKMACMDTQSGVVCETGTVSRREAKTAIEYVSDEERARLAEQALGTNLAHYRYTWDPENGRDRLGFIIQDMPDPSPAVDGDRTHVDQYGYTSMLLATIQQQQKQIDDLKKRVDEISATSCRP